MSYNNPYASFLAMSQLVTGPRKKPSTFQCPENMVAIGKVCYPGHNACGGDNESMTGFCDAQNRVNFKQDLKNMNLYIDPLIKN